MSFDAASVAGLRKWIAEEQEKVAGRMLAGQFSDWSEYRYSVGYARALMDTETVLEQIQADLQKG